MKFPAPAHGLSLRIAALLFLGLSLGVQAEEPLTPEQQAAKDLETIHVQVRTFEMQNGRLPTDQEGIRALVSQPEADLPRWRQLLEVVPKDPWGREYVYRTTEASRWGFVVSSLGPDPESNEDDIIFERE